MSSQTAGSSSFRAAKGPTIVGVYWPLRDEPIRSGLKVLLAVGVGVGAWWFSGQKWIGTVSSAVVAGAMWRTFVAATYELGIEGIAIRTLGRVRRIPWRAVAHFETGRTGVFLYRTTDPAPVDSLSAWFIPWCGARETVIAHLERFVLGLEPSGEGGAEAATVEVSRPSATGAPGQAITTAGDEASPDASSESTA